MRPFLLTLLLTLAQVAAADLVVVVHPDNPVAELSRNQVVDIFMGRLSHFPGGDIVLPLDQAPASGTRADFYRDLLGKTLAQVNAYWARLLFTGRATPPRVVNTPAGVVEVVSSNRAAIGYIDVTHIQPGVRIVYRVN